MPLLERARRALLGPAGVAPGSTGVVGLSGGPDSLALLDLLARLRPSVPLSIVAVVVDHGLRDGSAAEAARAAELARAADVPCEVVTLARQARAGNAQQWARQQRLLALGRVAHAHRADWIALGHTADDQAETVLMHALRGAGVRGLSGMADSIALGRLLEPLGAVAAQPGPSLPARDTRVVRPLLAIARRQIEAYHAARGLAPLEDPSNASATYLRNRLRQDLFPLLARENPAVVDTLCRLARSCGEECEALDRAADVCYRAAAGEGNALDTARLTQQPPAVLHRVLRRAYRATRGGSRQLGRAHLEALGALVSSDRGTQRLDLPGGAAVRRYGWLSFEPALTAPAPLGAMQVPGPGRYPLGPGRSLEVSRVPFHDADDRDTRLLLSADRARFPLCVRGPRPADRIEIAPGERKKVARVLIDAKIPRDTRPSIPLVLCGQEVLLVLGVRRAAGTAPAPGAPALRLRLLDEDDNAG